MEGLSICELIRDPKVSSDLEFPLSLIAPVSHVRVKVGGMFKERGAEVIDVKPVEIDGEVYDLLKTRQACYSYEAPGALKRQKQVDLLRERLGRIIPLARHFDFTYEDDFGVLNQAAALVQKQDIVFPLAFLISELHFKQVDKLADDEAEFNYLSEIGIFRLSFAKREIFESHFLEVYGVTVETAIDIIRNNPALKKDLKIFLELARELEADRKYFDFIGDNLSVVKNKGGELHLSYLDSFQRGDIDNVFAHMSMVGDQSLPPLEQAVGWLSDD